MKRKSKQQKKDAGGDEKLIIKFAWPNTGMILRCYMQNHSY